MDYMKCFLSNKSDIIIISEGLCDTEDWSNDAKNDHLKGENI